MCIGREKVTYVTDLRDIRNLKTLPTRLVGGRSKQCHVVMFFSIARSVHQAAFRSGVSKTTHAFSKSCQMLQKGHEHGMANTCIGDEVERDEWKQGCPGRKAMRPIPQTRGNTNRVLVLLVIFKDLRIVSIPILFVLHMFDSRATQQSPKLHDKMGERKVEEVERGTETARKTQQLSWHGLHAFLNQHAYNQPGC